MDKQQKKLMKRFVRACRWLAKMVDSVGIIDRPGVCMVEIRQGVFVIASIGITVGSSSGEQSLHGSTDDYREVLHQINMEFQVQKVEFNMAQTGYVLLPYWNILFWRTDHKGGGDPTVEELATQYDDARHAVAEAFIVATEARMKWWHKLIRR